MGIDEGWGILEAGRAANITVLSPSAEVIETFLAGQATLAEDNVWV
jgi:N-acetylglucosamine-6-phosphate deacetylase